MKGVCVGIYILLSRSVFCIRGVSAMSVDDQRAHLEKLLKTYTRNKNLLESQMASFGGEDTAPVHILNQLDAVRDKIKELQGQLDALGAPPVNSSSSSSASNPFSGSSVVNFGSGNNQSGANITIGDVAGRDIVKNQTSANTPQTTNTPTPRSTPTPNQVTLSFEPSDDGSASVNWGSSLLGRRVTKFSPPYDEATLPIVIKALDAAQYPNHPLGGPQFTADEQKILSDLKIWQGGKVSPNVHKLVGQAVYQALGADGINALEAVRNVAISQRQKTSYVLRFPLEAVEMAALPWEAITDSRNKAVLLSRGNDVDSCERYMDIDQAVPPPLTGGEVPHILALAPSYNIPDSVRQSERQARLETWDALKEKGLLTYDEIGTPLTRRALSDYLRRAERMPDIVHYFGHGVYKDGQGYLLFDDGNGGKSRVSADQLSSILGDIRLMVIMACESAHFEEEGGLLTGVAPALSIVTGAVVAMQLTARITAATRFAEVFYDELLNRKRSLQDAVAEGRQTLFFEEDDGASWYVPTIYIRSQEQKPFFLVQ